MVRCSLCDATRDGPAQEARTVGWALVSLARWSGVRYRVYCPAHDVAAVAADLREAWRALAGPTEGKGPRRG